MTAEFLVDENYSQPRLNVNSSVLDTEETRRLGSWAQQGYVLVSGGTEPRNRVIPGKIPGIRTHANGKLIVEESLLIKGTRCIALAIFNVIYNSTLYNDQFSNGLRGQAASKLKRYGRPIDEPPVALECFASPKLRDVFEIDEARGKLWFRSTCTYELRRTIYRIFGSNWWTGTLLTNRN